MFLISSILFQRRCIYDSTIDLGSMIEPFNRFHDIELMIELYLQ